MKKNLMSVLILALCIVNLILNCLLVFVCMPSSQKVNSLITEIAAVLKLELVGSDEPTVAIENIKVFQSTTDITINLKDDGSGTPHYAVVSIAISMDGSSEDYTNLSTLLVEGEGFINDDVRSVVEEYTITELNSQEVKNAIKKDVLKKIQKRFNTDCIYDVDFKNFLTS